MITVIDNQKLETQEAFSVNGAAEKPIMPDDDQLALDLVETWRGIVASIHQDWRRYQDGCWRLIDAEHVRILVREFLRQKRWMGVRVTGPRVKGVLELAKDDCHITDGIIAEQASERAKYINLKNGLYNIETHRLEPHRRDLYFLDQLPFSYDQHAECPTFEQFLTTSLVDASGHPDYELGALACQAIGYGLTARTDLKSAFWLVGPTNSGKSTFISLIGKLAGTLHTAIDLNDLGSRFGLGGIIGKRIATCTEANSRKPIQDDVFKTLTGGSDHIAIERKYKDTVYIVPEVKLFWGMNSAPRTTDQSGALLNRLRVILFNRTIPEAQRIRDLDIRLFEESAGIFNLAMYHYRMLQERGTFTQSQQADDWKENYRLKNDREASFMAACVEPDEKSTIKGQALYDAYFLWCKNNGFTPQNANNAAERWPELGLRKVHRNDGTHWIGGRIKYKE